MLWSCSDDTGATPRSRSSSLISPVPMPRFQHRSPSRSADLDRFTSDLERPRQIASAATVTSTYTASTAESSIRSSGISEFQPPAPQIPHADSRILTYFTSEVASFGSVPKLASLSIENEPVETPPVKARLLQRPSPPVRSSTAPIPSANSDVRFWIVAHDYDPRDITFNSEGNMIGASLSVLVEKMTPHDGPVDPTFWASFFYTFRLFTSPVLLLAAMMARYDLQPPPSIALGERERAVWIERKVVPVRLRIYNFLKAWLDTYWRSETDAVVLDGMRDFAIAVVSRTLPAMGPRLLEAVRRRQSGHVPSNPESGSLKRLSSTERLRAQAGVTYPPPMAGSLPPTPIISKSLNSLLQKNALIISITDFDTLELARQFTIMESKLFCAVVPEDLLQTGKKTIPSLKALSTLSNQITGWVADNVLNEQDAKKRAALLKFYIKLADVSSLLSRSRSELTGMVDAEMLDTAQLFDTFRGVSGAE